MKRVLFNLLVLLASVTTNRTSKYIQKVRKSQNTLYNTQVNRPARKLIFSPYVSLSRDLSADAINKEGEKEKETNHPELGPFQDAPVPAFGLGGMMPNSLGLTNEPYNYMYGSAMTHPLNPMGGMNAALQSNVNTAPVSSGLNQQVGSNDVNEFNINSDDIKLNDNYDVTRKLKVFDDPLNPVDGLIDNCVDTQKQAIEISNAIMKKQNKQIYEEIMKYLLKSRYLIAMTEIKLTRALRKKIYSLMENYSSITEDQIKTVSAEYEPISNTQLEQKIADKYFTHPDEFGITEPSFDDEMSEIGTMNRRN